MGRILPNWLLSYKEYSSESESPEAFHLWAALSVLASVVRRNIYLDQGIYKLFPNLYVALVGPPGRVGKSTTIRLARRLLLAVDEIQFGPDSLTREELIRIMAKVGKLGGDSAVTLHSTEWSSLIDPSGIKMIQFLTDIYDGDFKWRYATKGSGRNTITNPILNILAGTTPSWISDGLPADVIGHGFTARTIFVYGERPRYLKPFPLPPDPDLVESLELDLNHIANVEGKFQWGEGSKEEYARIYEKIAGSKPSDYRIEGFYNRKKIHVLKVAMLLSIAENDDLILSVRDINVAMQLLEAIEIDMFKSFSAVGKYDRASDLERIDSQIQESGGMSPKQIYDMFYAVGDVNEIGKIIHMLIAMGRIRREKDEKGNVTYRSVARDGPIQGTR